MKCPRCKNRDIKFPYLVKICSDCLEQEDFTLRIKEKELEEKGSEF